MNRFIIGSVMTQRHISASVGAIKLKFGMQIAEMQMRIKIYKNLA